MRRALAVVHDYGELVVALRNRAEQLNISNLVLDDVSGLQSGYTSKCLTLGLKRKTLGRLSLGVLLQALGLQLVVVEDPEALARVRPRLEPRRKNGMHRRPAGGEQQSSPVR
jgi:hypothetical protein